MNRLTLAAALFAASIPTLSAQTVEQTISLADPLTPITENAFGLAADPDGIHVYVALSGDFDTTFPSTPATAALFNNSRIVKINHLTGTLVAVGNTGLFPEDVALTTDAAGNTRHVFVTNSTSGTVSILDPMLNPVVDVVLPSCFGANFSAVFPFGILAAPDGSRVYVGTTGSCGGIEVIDSDPLSPTFSQVVASLSVPGFLGRMAWLAYPELVIAAADFATMSVGVSRVDVTNPASAVYVPAFTWNQGFGPGATDLAVRPNGNVLLPVSFADAPRLLEVEPLSGTVVQNINLSGLVSGTQLHGLGLSEDGNCAVVTNLGGAGEVVFIDVPAGTPFGVLPMGVQTLPNEVVFSPDQSRVIVTSQRAEQVVIYKDLPWFDLRLAVPATGILGQSVTAVLDNLESGQPAALYASVAGGGPQVVSGFTVHLTSPILLLTTLIGDVNGGGDFTLPLPSDPALVGVVAWLQGVTQDRDAGIRLSNGAQTTFQ